MRELESLGVKLDSKLDKVNVDKLVISDMKQIKDEEVHTKYKRAKWIVRIFAFLAELSLTLSLISCSNQEYTGTSIISRALRLEFRSWKEWGQVALAITSLLCIAIIVISLFESNKIFHKILSMTSAIFITSLVALIFYTIEDDYKVLTGFYILVLIYGGMFLTSIRGKACELKLLGEEVQQGLINIVPSYEWKKITSFCIGQIVINLFMIFYSKKIMDDKDLVIVAVIVLAWSVVTLIITLMKSRRCELCFMLQSISCVVMMAIGVGFCGYYRIRFRYLVDIMLWFGCLLVSPYRKLKVPDLRDIKTYQHKIKDDSFKIMKEVKSNIQNIDVQGLKSDLSSTYEVVKQMVKESGKDVETEEHKNQSIELKDKSKELMNKFNRVFNKIKPVLKSKVVLVAIGAIVVAVSIGNIYSNHKEIKDAFLQGDMLYKRYMWKAPDRMEEVENEFASLFDGLEKIEELREIKSAWWEEYEEKQKPLKKLMLEYGTDDPRYKEAFSLAHEYTYGQWIIAADNLNNAVEPYYNRRDELKQAREGLLSVRRELVDNKNRIFQYKDNKEYNFSHLIDRIDIELNKNILSDTLSKLDRCIEICEWYAY